MDIHWNVNRDSWNNPYLYGNDKLVDENNENFLSLQSQPWALLANLLSNETLENSLLNEIEYRLDADSPIGPRLR